MKCFKNFCQLTVDSCYINSGCTPYDRNGGHGSAVSLPQNNHKPWMNDVTIARLIVGTRQCSLVST